MELSCSEAPTSDWEASCTWPTTLASFSTMFLMDAIMLVVSPGCRSTWTARSPAATCWAMEAASMGSPPTWRLIMRVTRRPSPMANAKTTTVVRVMFRRSPS